MTSTVDRRALAAKLENILLTVWPSHSTVMLGGWCLRLAGGYSGRANSASALVPDATLDDAQLGRIMQHYATAGLPATVRVTPVAATSVARLLQDSGFRPQNAALTQIAALTDKLHHGGHLELATEPHGAWLDGVCRSQSGAKRFPDKLEAIVSRITVPHCFATLTADGEAAAFGLCAVDQGWAEIGCVMVEAQQRGKGHGQALVAGLMHWAKTLGAASAFLQVDANNAPALRLYRKLGFTTLYPYDTWVYSTPDK